MCERNLLRFSLFAGSLMRARSNSTKFRNRLRSPVRYTVGTSGSDVDVSSGENHGLFAVDDCQRRGLWLIASRTTLFGLGRVATASAMRSVARLKSVLGRRSGAHDTKSATADSRCATLDRTVCGLPQESKSGLWPQTLRAIVDSGHVLVSFITKYVKIATETDCGTRCCLQHAPT